MIPMTDRTPGRRLPAIIPADLPYRKPGEPTGAGVLAWPCTRDSDDLLDHLALDEGEPLVAAQVGIGEAVLVEPELVEDRGVDVAEVVGTLDCVQADRVGGANDLASLDAAAGHPH